MAQVCAYELGLPVANVFASGSNTVMEVNNANSGGSVTSESCCQVNNVIASKLELLHFRNK